MTNAERRQLDEQGFVVLENCMGGELLRELREQIHEVSDIERDRAGHEFRTEANAHRLANLVDKGEVFRRAIVLPRVVERVRHVLGPQIKLSSLNARSADPNGELPQPLHVDMSALPDEQGYWVCNTIWMLDDFTPENGATRMIPRSHTWGRLPEPGNRDAHPDQQLVTGRAGTVVVMNTHMWHAGTGNRTDRCRRALHGFYTRGDKPQQQFQKALLRAQTVATLSPVQRKVLAIDDPENDRLSSQTTRMSGFLKD